MDRCRNRLHLPLPASATVEDLQQMAPQARYLTRKEQTVTMIGEEATATTATYPTQDEIDQLAWWKIWIVVGMYLKTLILPSITMLQTSPLG